VIARFVRQTRTVIYENPRAGKSFFFAFPVQTRALLRFVAILLRQTRTHSGGIGKAPARRRE
jgi:hypothetical protein